MGRACHLGMLPWGPWGRNIMDLLGDPRCDCLIFSLGEVFFSGDFHIFSPGEGGKGLVASILWDQRVKGLESPSAHADSHIVPRFLNGTASHPLQCLARVEGQGISFSFLFRVKRGGTWLCRHEEGSCICLSDRLSTNPPDFSLYLHFAFQTTWCL